MRMPMARSTPHPLPPPPPSSVFPAHVELLLSYSGEEGLGEWTLVSEGCASPTGNGGVRVGVTLQFGAWGARNVVANVEL